jgi:ribosomal protein S18 acetylase RimI-like enzyme
MIRDATSDDAATVIELWREFEAEVPEPAWRDDEAETRQRKLERTIGTDIVLLAEQDARPIGLAVADTKGERVGFLHILYVRPSARQLGVAAALVRATADRLRAQGRDMLELEVLASNERARSVYDRWGFEPAELTLAANIDTLVEGIRANEERRTDHHSATEDLSASELSLRFAEIADLPALSDLFRRASLSNEGDRASLLAHPDALELSARAVEEGRVRVAAIENRIVGFATIVVTDQSGELDDLFVDPDCRRRGIATALVLDALDHAADQELTRIEVTANPHALAFYESVGFVSDGMRQTRFGPGHRMHINVPPSSRSG